MIFPSSCEILRFHNASRALHFEKDALFTISNRPTSERRGLTLEPTLSLYELLTTSLGIFQLQPQAAVVKALGELDILLSWMEEMD